MIKFHINFNNIKNPCIKKKIYKLFFFALEDKIRGKVLFESRYFEGNIRYANKAEIRSLNKEFRNVDTPTDVLSFPLIDFNEEDLKEINLLGDIVICKEVAKEQAKQLGHPLNREICFLALHGFLHLLGYNHIDEDEEKQMIEKSKEILSRYKVRR